MVNAQATELKFGATRVVHTVMPPHAPDGYTSVSEPLSIGVSFTGHAQAVVENGPTREWSFPPGTCAVSGTAPTTWLRVREPAEALEIHAGAAELARVAQETGADWQARPESLSVGQDPVIWGICARFRMAALDASPIEAGEADSLVHTLLVHVATRHLGARAPRRPRGRLDRRRLARVAEFIESALDGPPSLREMADVAAMSPFHFQRMFRCTTGLTPHAYVSARRMERARRMLVEPGTTVAGVAAATGFSDVAHFRRAFHRVFNAPPRVLRDA